MWKYIDKDKSNEFLLSLNLLEGSLIDKNKIIKLYSISNNIEKNYKIYKIKKSNGKYRTIYEPTYNLKYIQRQILNNILSNITISKYAKAYKKGVSLKDNAIEHINKKILLKLDIKHFFDNITFTDIYNTCFGIEYFPKNIGMLLTYLCTYYDYLPQGAPTSAYISNLVMYDFDNIIGSFCEENNISYTRYSDDMTFSGDFNPSIVIKKVNEELKKLSLELNYDKVKIIKNNNRQSVTGIVVNNKLQVSKTVRKKIRQEVYYINKYGINSHLNKINCKDKEKYLNSLYGKILYVLQINNKDLEFVEYKKTIRKLINSL